MYAPPRAILTEKFKRHSCLGSRQNFQLETIILIPHGVPEGDSSLIVNQDFHRQLFMPRPDFGAQNLKRGAPMSLPAAVAHDKKLPQIDFCRQLTEEGVGDHFAVIFKKYGGIFGREPCPHALLQFGNRHRVEVALVADELVIQLCKQRAIIRIGMATIQLLWFGCRGGW